MEKIKDPIQKELPPLKIYKDELYELHECLKNNCGGIIIETCGYRLSSLDEIDKLPEKETNYIKFQCSRPYLNIRLNGYRREEVFRQIGEAGRAKTPCAAQWPPGKVSTCMGGKDVEKGFPVGRSVLYA